jgi:TonB family protein
MKSQRFVFFPYELHRASIRLMQAAAVTLLLTLALSARAADERPVKSRVQPVYPEIAKRMKITGEVRLTVKVNADGSVTGVEAISGNNILRGTAEDAVRKWTFVPAPDPSTVIVAINFAL